MPGLTRHPVLLMSEGEREGSIMMEAFEGERTEGEKEIVVSLVRQ